MIVVLFPPYKLFLVKHHIKNMKNYFIDEIGVDQFDRNHFILFDSGGHSINDLLAEHGITEPCARNFKLRALDSTTPSCILESPNQKSLMLSDTEFVIPKTIRREEIEIQSIYEASICYKDENFVYLRLAKHNQMLQDLNNLLQLTFAENKSENDQFEIDQLIIFGMKDRKTQKISFYRGKITKSVIISNKICYHVTAEDVGFSTRVRPKMMTSLPLDCMKYPTLCIPAKTSLSVLELKNLKLKQFKVSFYYNDKSELYFSAKSESM